MRARRQFLPACARRLRACRRGLALVEFALALPILLAIALYGFECASIALTNLRVSNITTLTADNHARVRESIDEANVIEVMTGAKATGSSIGFAPNARIIVSSFEPTTDGTQQWIRWQRCDGALNVSSSYGGPRTAAGALITNGTEFLATNRTSVSAAPSSQAHASARLGPVGRPGEQIMALPGNAVIVVEVIYNYQPIVGNWLFGPIQVRYEDAFVVRQRTDQSLRNAGRITPRSCNNFSA